jgi:Zn finger protein HypA/HybF involved in hydrogenase expression
MCKKCKKAFRKDMTAYEESDEYCPHCDNHYVSLSHERMYLSVDLCVFREGHRGEDATGCHWN